MSLYKSLIFLISLFLAHYFFFQIFPFLILKIPKFSRPTLFRLSLLVRKIVVYLHVQKFQLLLLFFNFIITIYVIRLNILINFFHLRTYDSYFV